MRIAIFNHLLGRNLVLAGILFLGCSIGVAESGLKALARVGEYPINQIDLEREIRGRLEFAKLAGKRFDSLDPKFLSVTLDRLIERRILLLYGRETSVIKEDKVERVVSDFIEKMGGESKAEVKLKSAGVDWESWKANFKDDVRLMMVADVFSQKFGNPKKEEVQAFLKENPKLVYDPERLRVSVIVIDATNSLASDEKLSGFVKALKDDPDSFPEKAKKFSDGASAKTGGDVGFIAKGAYDRSIEEVLYKLKVGEVSDAIPFQGKNYIFKVEDHKGGKLNEEERFKVAAEALGVQKSREELRKMVAILRERMKVEKYQ